MVFAVGLYKGHWSFLPWGPLIGVFEKHYKIECICMETEFSVLQCYTTLQQNFVMLCNIKNWKE